MSIRFITPDVPEETEKAILRLVVRQYPNGGANHERAIRMAILLAWTAGCAFDANTKEHQNG